MPKSHNPFDWVHSEFAFLASLIILSAGFVFTTFKPSAPLGTLTEGLLALNGLFWVKQYKKNDQEIQKIKLLNGGNVGSKTGDPLS